LGVFFFFLILDSLFPRSWYFLWCQVVWRLRIGWH